MYTLTSGTSPRDKHALATSSTQHAKHISHNASHKQPPLLHDACANTRIRSETPRPVPSRPALVPTPVPSQFYPPRSTTHPIIHTYMPACMHASTHPHNRATELLLLYSDHLPTTCISRQSVIASMGPCIRWAVRLFARSRDRLSS